MRDTPLRLACGVRRVAPLRVARGVDAHDDDGTGSRSGPAVRDDVAVRRRIPDADGKAALQAWATGAASRAELGTAVRWTLQLLARRHPGGSLEVRVPPFGVVQCVEGVRHTRGTPPNVVETDADTWLALATGATTWQLATDSGVVHASGERADLATRLPVIGESRSSADGAS